MFVCFSMFMYVYVFYDSCGKPTPLTIGLTVGN